ncbi:MAG: 4-hydroxy-tetrahydrodipicolinate reductase [Planctomycetes bacterium]|nr:4-hydroxy-tetrahydrodipicolinate reductase [Planctomycetota bacterium]
MTTKNIRAAVVGARGRMGRLACDWIRASGDLELAAEIEIGDSIPDLLIKSKAEVALDFTVAHVARENALAIARCGVRPVIGTSGLNRDDLDELARVLNEKRIGGIVVPNFTIGAVLAMRFAREAARWFPSAEVIEAHHPTKADAPSGTARATAMAIADAREHAPADRSKELIAGSRGGDVSGVRVHSLRLPGVVANQEIWFGGEGEVLKITHESTDRSSFRGGVLLAIRSVPAVCGLVLGLESLLFAETK